MKNNPCAEFLKSGIYETYNFTNSGNFQYDFKHYITTEEFKKDFKSGKFNIGFEAIDPATLITEKLSLGASDEEINEFMKKIHDNTDLVIKQSFFTAYAYSKPNELATKMYFECAIRQANQKGFSSHIVQVGNLTTLTVFFNKIDSKDPNAKVEHIILDNAILVSKNFNIGDDLNIENEITVKVIDNTKPLLISIDTDHGPVTEIVEVKKQKSTDGNPIGTIINSFLNWEQFQEATENNKQTESGKWESEFSFWSPCDGREVPNSELQKIASITKVPDSRGVFLRGLNVFDAVGEFGGMIKKAETDFIDTYGTRIVGSYQKDEFRAHDHSYFAPISSSPIRGSGGYAPENPSSGTTGRTGGKETRPKNIAVYCYIKIN